MSSLLYSHIYVTYICRNSTEGVKFTMWMTYFTSSLSQIEILCHFNPPIWPSEAVNVVVHLFYFFLITHGRELFTFGLVFHGSPETCMALLSSTEAAVLPCMSRQRKREKYTPAHTVKELILREGSLITFFLPDNLPLTGTFTLSGQKFWIDDAEYMFHFAGKLSADKFRFLHETLVDKLQQRWSHMSIRLVQENCHLNGVTYKYTN